jgi:hypothetical protein
MNKYTKEEKKKLLEQSNFMDMLNSKQVWNIILWEFFKPKKFNQFLESIEMGKHAWAAYSDADKLKTKTPHP